MLQVNPGSCTKFDQQEILHHAFLAGNFLIIYNLCVRDLIGSVILHLLIMDSCLVLVVWILLSYLIKKNQHPHLPDFLRLAKELPTRRLIEIYAYSNTPHHRVWCSDSKAGLVDTNIQDWILGRNQTSVPLADIVLQKPLYHVGFH